ncbi:Abnormal spindle-like microcephaly-associated protein homolog [Durusdinium trenchii]|uniref:Abnormal spindle-like microcephaly-associated protein homolog n=1 Tax=Durusdinium trenchii TaxID=1381693 RepID=A0ABP0K7S9_9DINO
MCGAVQDAAAVSSFCDRCFETVMKTEAKDLGRIHGKLRRKHSVEKSFLVEMVSRKYKSGFRVHVLAEPAKRGHDASKSVEHRIDELAKVFGVTPGSSNQVANLAPRPQVTENARRIERLRECHLAAAQGQKLWRGFAIRRRFSGLRDAVVILQAHVRGALCRSSPALAEIVARRHAAVSLQCAVRKRCAKLRRAELVRLAEERQELEHAAATALQRVFRGHHSATMFREHRESALLLQRVARTRHAQKKARATRADLADRREAARLLQRYARGRQGRVRARDARRGVQEDLAARAIQRSARLFISKMRVRIVRLQMGNLQHVWEAVAQVMSSKPSAAKAARLLSESMPAFDEEEAKVHIGLWLLVCAMEFEQAIDVFQECVRRGDGKPEDPRACYGLCIALRMRNDARLKRGKLIQGVAQGKRLDARANLFGGDYAAPVLFGPNSRVGSERPCLEELDFLLRRGLLLPCTSDSVHAKRLCMYSVFLGLVCKDQGGAQHFAFEAMRLQPANNFVLACLYGRNATGLESYDVTEEDFNDIGAMEPVFVKSARRIRDYTVDLSVFERGRRSKWGRTSHCEFDLLVVVRRSGDLAVGDESPHRLVITSTHINRYCAFLDQPTWVRPAKRHHLFKLLVDSVDLVRTERAKGTVVQPNLCVRDAAELEAEWATLRPALRFVQPAFATLVQTTANGHVLSVACFLENCTRLRVTAYCEALDDSFGLVLSREQLEQLCLDSPHMRRMFAQHGWRSAVSHTALIARVAQLLELAQPPGPDPDAKFSYVRTDTLVVQNRVMERPFTQTLDNLGVNSGLRLVLSGFDERVWEVRQNWAAFKIQSLFHTHRAVAAAHELRKDRAATMLQALWRATRARNDFAALHADMMRHRSATRIASVVRMLICKRTRFLSRLQHVFDQRDVAWDSAWQALHFQRHHHDVTYRRFWALAFEQKMFNAMNAPAVGAESNAAGVMAQGLGLLLWHGHVTNDALRCIRKAWELDPDLVSFRFFQGIFLDRASRMHPSSSRIAAVRALVDLVVDDVFSEEFVRFRSMEEDSVERVASEVAWEWQQERVEAAGRIQRMFRSARNSPSLMFELTVSMACARQRCELAIGLGEVELDDLETHAFATQAIQQEWGNAKDLLALGVRRFPQHAAFHYGQALIQALLANSDAQVAKARALLEPARRLDPQGNDFRASVARFFSQAVLLHKSDPERLAVSQLQLALVHLLVFDKFSDAFALVRTAMQSSPSSVMALRVHTQFLSRGQRELSAAALQRRATLARKRSDWEQEGRQQMEAAKLARMESRRESSRRLHETKEWENAQRRRVVKQEEDRRLREKQESAWMQAEDTFMHSREMMRQRTMRETLIPAEQLLGNSE